MKNRWIYFVHILSILAVIAGFGYSQAKGQASTPEPPPAPQAAAALGSGFTYQGSLKQSGSPVSGNCDFQFGLWSASSLGTQLGVTQTLTSAVSSGLFSAQLNGSGQYGTSAFDGSPRWLAVTVRCPSGSGSYTSLGRQALTAAPYALYSSQAGTAALFSGALSGDVTGTQGSTTVTKLQGVAVSATVPTSGQMLKYDGAQWAPGGYQNVLVVAKSGGNYATISAALAAITDAGDTNRYLVRVMPGIYSEQVTMKPYVDIEGSGELATRITYTGSASNTSGTLFGASNAELRFLTVENTGGADWAIAVYNNSASPRLTHVTASASGGTSNYAVLDYNAPSPAMTDLTASASGGADNVGIFNFSSSPVIQNGVIRASGGTNNYGIYNYAINGAWTVKVSNSQVTGSTNTIRNYSYTTTRIGATLLDGGPVYNEGTLTCAGVYDENYTFYASTCP